MREDYREYVQRCLDGQDTWESPTPAQVMALLDLIARATKAGEDLAKMVEQMVRGGQS